MAKRYKGRYVAQVEIDFDVDAERSNILPFDKIKENVSNEFTPAIKEVIEGEIIDDDGKVTVTQQYADLWEVEEDA